MKTKQADKIIRHLKKYGSITAAEVVQEYGIYRLAARISDIKELGFLINSRTENGKNRFGKKHISNDIKKRKGMQSVQMIIWIKTIFKIMLVICIIIRISVEIRYRKNKKHKKMSLFIEKKYIEIVLLALKLNQEKIKFETKKLYDGYKMTVFLDNGEKVIVEEHAHSYGSVMDLLEIIDTNGGVKKGFQTAEQALRFIKEKNDE